MSFITAFIVSQNLHGMAPFCQSLRVAMIKMALIMLIQRGEIEQTF